MPQPVVVGLVKMWRIREVRDWIDAGCPTPACEPHWQWRPTIRVSLREYEALVVARIAEAEAELAEIRRRGDAGESSVHVNPPL